MNTNHKTPAPPPPPTFRERMEAQGFVAYVGAPSLTLFEIKFAGRRLPDGTTNVLVIAPAARRSHMTLALPHLKHHSTDTFNWGYGGSGPSDLALALLEFTIQFSTSNAISKKQTVPLWGGEQCTLTAWRLHHDYKFQVVAGFGDQWEIDAESVWAWLIASSVLKPNLFTDPQTASEDAPLSLTDRNPEDAASASGELDDAANPLGD